MSSAARKIARRAVQVEVCHATTVEEPCTQQVRYRATLVFTGCGHQTPGNPLALCHHHAYAAQQHPIAPGLHSCPYCKTIGHVGLARMTEA